MAISNLIVHRVRRVKSGLSLLNDAVPGRSSADGGSLRDITWVSSWCLHFNGSNQGVDLGGGGYRKPLKQNEER